MYPFGYNVKESNDEIFIWLPFSKVILQIHKCRFIWIMFIFSVPSFKNIWKIFDKYGHSDLVVEKSFHIWLNIHNKNMWKLIFWLETLALSRNLHNPTKIMTHA